MYSPFLSYIGSFKTKSKLGMIFIILKHTHLMSVLETLSQSDVTFLISSSRRYMIHGYYLQP